MVRMSRWASSSRRLWLLAVLLAALTLCAQSPPDFREDLEWLLFARVNQERAARGLPPLRWNDRLQRSSRAHALKLGEYRMLSHRFKDEPPLSARMAGTGLHFSSAAENVALATDPADLHPGWMSSDGHRANILDPQYDSLGVAVLRQDRVYYAVQNFARVAEDLSPEEAASRLIFAMNDFRRRLGLPRLDGSFSASISEAACDMARRDKAAADLIPSHMSDRGVTAFTAPDPAGLTPDVRDFARRPDLVRLRVGACFQVTKSYPGGTYWFGIAF
jgi:hypothetical protein